MLPPPDQARETRSLPPEASPLATLRDRLPALPRAASRRRFLATAAGSLGVAALESPQAASADDERKPVVWDMHCHLGGFDGDNPIECMANLMKYADRMGIDRVLLYLGRPPYLHDPTPEQLRNRNDQVLAAIARWPGRAFGLVYLNPKHTEFSLAEFDRCVHKGPMVGVKLWVASRASQRQLDPIVEAAVACDAIIYQHTWLKTPGNLPGESTPMDVAELARRHPQARLICGHSGGDWERGIRAIRKRTNVSLGIAGFDPTAA